MDAIITDPGYNSGRYTTPADVREGLVQHGLLWSVMGLSTEWRKRERWRPLGFASAENFRVGFVDTYFSVLDPNRLIAQGWKWQRGDFSRHTDGDLAAALGRVTAKMFVMPIDEAIFFPRGTAPRSSLASPKQRAAGRRERQRALGPLRL